MTDTPPTDLASATISSLLRDVLAQEDLDSCAIIANTINIYLDAIKRRGTARDLYADDIIAIFKIVRVLLGAADIEHELAQYAPKRKLAGKPEHVE